LCGFQNCHDGSDVMAAIWREIRYIGRQFSLFSLFWQFLRKKKRKKIRDRKER